MQDPRWQGKSVIPIINTSILIVDDDPVVAKTLKRQLDKINIKSHIAENGQTAIDLLADSNNNIAILMCDYRMPDLEGREVLLKAKDQRPDIVRILMTGDIDQANKADNEPDKLAAFVLSKPWKTESLKETIEQALKLRNGNHKTENCSDQC